jgi:hypothetical protein
LPIENYEFLISYPKAAVASRHQLAIEKQRADGKVAVDHRRSNSDGSWTGTHLMRNKHSS